MQDILTQIVAGKREEVAAARAAISLEELEAKVAGLPAPGRSMRAGLAASPYGIIAEFKRKSPSKGWIHEDARPEDVVPAYCRNGASALSILTDGPWFGGSPAFVEKVRGMVDIPILRKDFIIDAYQLLEAKLMGADAVLLIAACLGRGECSELLERAHSLGLEVLLETHTPAELEYVTPGVDMVGVNNRNLGTFHTDVRNSFAMAEALAGKADSVGGPLLVSESGISSPETVLKLREAGFRGFLMGENFMKQAVPGDALREFIEALDRGRSV